MIYEGVCLLVKGEDEVMYLVIVNVVKKLDVLLKYCKG